MNGWRLTLLLAARQTLRAKGRSALVLTLVALPVLAVAVIAIVARTTDLSSAESVPQQMGSAQARFWYVGQGAEQASDPAKGYMHGEPSEDGPDLEAAAQVLGAGARVVPTVWQGRVRVRVDDRLVDVHTRELDLADDVAAGVFELDRGRLPARVGEVLVNQAVIDAGHEVGDTLSLEGGGAGPEIVGVGVDVWARTLPMAVGPIGSFGGDVDEEPSWLVEGPEVTWSDVTALNKLGFLVASRSVLLDPSEADSEFGVDTEDASNGMAEVVAMIAVMVLAEVVLLAGPAFAVGAKQHSRTIALVALNGGTRRQARRVVMASALVLGSLGTILGILLGLLVATALVPILQRVDNVWWGPLDVPWSWLLGVAGCGLLAALLAAAVPAWSSARHDVVRVLAGRRSPTSTDPRVPVLGLVLLGGGIAGTAYAVLTSGGDSRAAGIVAIALVAVVIGMVLVVPTLVVGLARAARGLPFAARFAARDAARHRVRSVPAVAAIAGVVAGVVAIGISTSSDLAQSEQQYRPSLAMGDTAVTTWFERPPAGGKAAWFATLREVVERTLPDAEVRTVETLDAGEADEGGWSLRLGETWAGQNGRFGLGAEIVVADTVDFLGLASADAARAQEALDRGRAVVLEVTPVAVDRGVLVWEDWSQEQARRKRVVPVPVDVLRVDAAAPAAVVLPTALVESEGIDTVPTALLITSALDREQSTLLAERIQAVDPDAMVSTERGFEATTEALIVQGVLGMVGALLMLAGTLTATSLALGDARPDLATLSAVGAEPRVRRRVAGWYAFGIAGLGAWLGAVVGFVPGLALARSLTVDQYLVPGVPQGPFYAVPWLLVAAIVVGLPVVMGCVVALGVRSKLPMVARVE